MDIQPPKFNPDNCSKHNQPILIYNSDLKIGACCLVCLQQQPGNISVEQFNKQQQDIYKQANKNIVFNNQIYQQLLENLLIYKQKIIFSLDKIMQIIVDQIKIMKEYKTQLNSIIMSNNGQQERINKLRNAFDNQVENDKQFKEQVKNQLNEFSSKFSNINECVQLLSKNADQEILMKIESENGENISIQQVKVKNGEKQKKFQYALIKESTIKEDNTCRSFAFNEDNTILCVAMYKNIVVYEFNDGKIINEFQRLDNHISNVTCLYYMKKSNSFISGGWDQIIIWVYDQHNNWIAQQEFDYKKYGVSCILMNKMENQFISGSYETIKFWNNNKGNWTCQQSIQVTYDVMNMSLNEMEDKLIAIENETKKELSCIKVYMQKNKKWRIVQAINYNECGFRLGFTIEDQFVFTTVNSDQLTVYDYNTDKKEFLKIKQVQIQAQSECWFDFPCQFIKSLRILTFKNGKYLNIIKVDENKNYELIQQIRIGHKHLFGCVSDDGQYIVTWDGQSNEIKFRKVKYDN